MKRVAYVWVAAAVLMVMLLQGCTGSKAVEETSVAVALEPVRRGSVLVVSHSQGVLAASAEAHVSSKIAGRIEQVFVRVGDEVEANEALLVLETDELRAYVKQAEAALEAARANLRRLTAGASDAELAQAKAAVAQAEAAYSNAKETYERMEVLYAAGAVSRQQRDQARTQYEVAGAQLDIANKQMEIVQRGASKDAIDAARASVAQAEAALELARLQLAQAAVRTPIKGKVSYVNARVGNLVSPGVPLAGVVDDELLEVDFPLTERQVTRVRRGDRVEVQVPSVTYTTDGEVVHVSPAADTRTRVYQMRVRIDNPGYLLPGMFARLTLVEDSAADVLVIPLAAVLRAGQDAYVFTVNDNRAYEKRVVLGLSDGTWIQVIEGLSEQDMVVTRGQHYLSPGARVTVEGGNW